MKRRLCLKRVDVGPVDGLLGLNVSALSGSGLSLSLIRLRVLATNKLLGERVLLAGIDDTHLANGLKLLEVSRTDRGREILARVVAEPLATGVDLIQPR